MPAVNASMIAFASSYAIGRQAPVRRYRDRSIPVVLVVFDVLAVEGVATLWRPYGERQERLEALGLRGRCWQTAPAFGVVLTAS